MTILQETNHGLGLHCAKCFLHSGPLGNPVTFQQAHFTDENLEAQRPEVPCPRSHSWEVVGQGFEPGSVWPQSPFVFPLVCPTHMLFLPSGILFPLSPSPSPPHFLHTFTSSAPLSLSPRALPRHQLPQAPATDLGPCCTFLVAPARVRDE